MHAVIMDEFGSADVLRPGEFPDPAERQGWVTVALRASALNWHDVLVRQGRYRSPLPHIIGADGAGVRTDTGEPVVVLPSLNWGDRDDAPGTRWEILGDHTPGTYAELVSVPVDCLAPKPVGMSWAEAAALPLVGVTTYRGRRRHRHHGDRPCRRRRSRHHGDILIDRNHRARGGRGRPRRRAAQRNGLARPCSRHVA